MSAGAITSAGSSSLSTNAFASLTSGDFIKVMISELSNQDPLQPQDSGKLLEQFSNLRNVESQLQLQDSLKSLVLQNQISSAGGMIGKMVTGLDAQNAQVAGQVLAVQVIDNKAVLQLDSGDKLPMDRVTAIASGDGTTSGGTSSATALDVNQDGKVDLQDQSALADNWLQNLNKPRSTDANGLPIPPTFKDGDFNRDGAIDSKDLILLQQIFSQ